MSAKIISLSAFRKAKLWRKLKQRLERGELYLPKARVSFYK
jgi:hypothetical protein